MLSLRLFCRYLYGATTLLGMQQETLPEAAILSALFAILYEQIETIQQ